MPRLDGSGPQGEGALTGRGDGRCAPAQPKAGTQGVPVTGRRPLFGLFRRGLGRGRGAGGRGRGRGRGRWFRW